MKNAFVAAFGAVYFYVSAKVFKYRLMSKHFFGVEFKFWAGKEATHFQFILIKKTKRAVLTNYGTKCEFSLLSLYKELKRQLDKVLKREKRHKTTKKALR